MKQFASVFLHLKPTLIFYSIATALVLLGNYYAPAGPCAPGLGHLIFFLLMPVVGILLFMNFYKAVSKKGAQYFARFVFHLLVVIVGVILMQ